MKVPLSPGREMFKHRTLWPRFRDAFRGVWAAYREEPNLRFHIFAAACVTAAGRAVRLQGWEIAYLAVTVVVVLVAELFNTAVERTVDLAGGGRRNPLAASAKQLASGAVLIAALHASGAAVVLFLVQRPLTTTLRGLFTLIGSEPWWLVPPLVTGVLGMVGGNHRAD